MRKAVLFIVSLIFSIATCSQSGGRTRDAFEVKHSIFFADGSLDEYMETKWDSGYTRVDNEVRYSASETMLEQVEYSYNDDKDGRKNMKVTLNAERQMKNKVVYQYDPQTGRLSREVLADSKGRPISIYLYSYDNRGNLVSRVIQNSRTGNKLAETIYTYDANGKMVTSETRDAGNNRISSTRYSYDSQGNLVNQQVFNGEGRITSIISSVFQAGRETRNEIAAPDGSIQMRVTNEYGRDSELTRKTIENIQGASKQIIQYEYVFRPRRQS